MRNGNSFIVFQWCSACELDEKAANNSTMSIALENGHRFNTFDGYWILAGCAVCTHCSIRSGLIQQYSMPPSVHCTRDDDDDMPTYRFAHIYRHAHMAQVDMDEPMLSFLPYSFSRFYTKPNSYWIFQSEWHAFITYTHKKKCHDNWFSYGVCVRVDS